MMRSQRQTWIAIAIALILILGLIFWRPGGDQSIQWASYRVNGTLGAQARINYTIYDVSGSREESVLATLPWSFRTQYQPGNTLAVTAENTGGDQPISCTISLEGATVPDITHEDPQRAVCTTIAP